MDFAAFGLILDTINSIMMDNELKSVPLLHGLDAFRVSFLTLDYPDQIAKVTEVAIQLARVAVTTFCAASIRSADSELSEKIEEGEANTSNSDRSFYGSILVYLDPADEAVPSPAAYTKLDRAHRVAG